MERHKGRGVEEEESEGSGPSTVSTESSRPAPRSASDERLSALEAQVQDLRGRLADLSDAYDSLLARVERMSG